jgi:hypothetical protein
VNLKLIFKKKKERTSNHKSSLYEKANWRKFMQSIDVALTNLDARLDVDSQNHLITQALNQAAEQYIPKVNESSKRDQHFPKHIKYVLKERNKWYKNYRSFRSEYATERCKELEERATELILEFKQEQGREFLARRGNSPVSTIPFWKRINRLREGKKRKQVGNLVVDGIEIVLGKDKADIFAKSLEIFSIFGPLKLNIE